MYGRTTGFGIFWAVIAGLAGALPLRAQTKVGPITESMVTFGRGGAYRSNDNFIANAVALADIGVQWTQPSGRGFGISLTGGRDFPNEASLLGLRVRASRPLGPGRVEGSAALMASSIGEGGIGHPVGYGGSLGISYWPTNWFAVAGQVDVMPTYADDQALAASPQITRAAAFSFGVRLGRWPAVATWVGAGLAALAWAATEGMSFGIGM